MVTQNYAIWLYFVYLTKTAFASGMSNAVHKVVQFLHFSVSLFCSISADHICWICWMPTADMSTMEKKHSRNFSLDVHPYMLTIRKPTKVETVSAEPLPPDHTLDAVFIEGTHTIVHVSASITGKIAMPNLRTDLSPRQPNHIPYILLCPLILVDVFDQGEKGEK